MLATSGCPIRVRAQPGQRLNVTVWDFSGPLMHKLNMKPDMSLSSRNDVINVRALVSLSNVTPTPASIKATHYNYHKL